MSLMASSYVSARTTASTGPKISSRYASAVSGTRSSSETPRKKPSSWPSTL